MLGAGDLAGRAVDRGGIHGEEVGTDVGARQVPGGQEAPLVEEGAVRGRAVGYVVAHVGVQRLVAGPPPGDRSRRSSFRREQVALPKMASMMGSRVGRSSSICHSGRWSWLLVRLEAPKEYRCEPRLPMALGVEGQDVVDHLGHAVAESLQLGRGQHVGHDDEAVSAKDPHDVVRPGPVRTPRGRAGRCWSSGTPRWATTSGSLRSNSRQPGSDRSADVRMGATLAGAERPRPMLAASAPVRCWPRPPLR